MIIKLTSEEFAVYLGLALMFIYFVFFVGVYHGYKSYRQSCPDFEFEDEEKLND